MLRVSTKLRKFKIFCVATYMISSEWSTPRQKAVIKMFYKLHVRKMYFDFEIFDNIIVPTKIEENLCAHHSSRVMMWFLGACAHYTLSTCSMSREIFYILNLIARYARSSGYIGQIGVFGANMEKIGVFWGILGKIREILGNCCKKSI